MDRQTGRPVLIRSRHRTQWSVIAGADPVRRVFVSQQGVAHALLQSLQASKPYPLPAAAALFAFGRGAERERGILIGPAFGRLGSSSCLYIYCRL
jgi:hypothetical protein